MEKNKGNVNGCWSGHVPIPRFRSKLVSWGSLGVETTINNNYCVRSISGRYILNIPLPTWSKTRYASNSVRNATNMLKNVEKNVEKSKIIKKKCWKSKYVPNTIIFVDPFFIPPSRLSSLIMSRIRGWEPDRTTSAMSGDAYSGYSEDILVRIPLPLFWKGAKQGGNSDERPKKSLKSLKNL